MTGGQCSSPYPGLALLTDTDTAQHRLRSRMPASYADFTLSAHSSVLIGDEFASEHSRAVHLQALKTHVWAQSPPWHLTNQRHVQACALRGEAGGKSAHMQERSAIPHSDFVFLPKSECQTAKSERHARIHVSGS